MLVREQDHSPVARRANARGFQDCERLIRRQECRVAALRARLTGPLCKWDYCRGLRQINGVDYTLRSHVAPPSAIGSGARSVLATPTRPVFSVTPLRLWFPWVVAALHFENLGEFGMRPQPYSSGLNHRRCIYLPSRDPGLQRLAGNTRMLSDFACGVKPRAHNSSNITA